MRIGKRGFTLIELMVVVAVIAILATLIVIDTSQSRAKARDVNRKESVSAISLALEQRYATTKNYFVQMPGGDCTASNTQQYDKVNPQDPDNQNKNFYLLATNPNDASCVGFQGGGEGRANAKNNGTQSQINQWYPNTNDSIDDALYQGGYLATIPIDPLDTDFSQAVGSSTSRDFLITLCDGLGLPASTSDATLNYGVFAQLELPNLLGAQELDTTDHSCGAIDSQYPWNYSAYP